MAKTARPFSASGITNCLSMFPHITAVRSKYDGGIVKDLTLIVTNSFSVLVQSNGNVGSMHRFWCFNSFEQHVIFLLTSVDEL